MKTIQRKIILSAFLILAVIVSSKAQNEAWTLDDCINYALEKNIDVRKSILSTREDEYNLEQSKANVLPSVSGSASTSFTWAKEALSESNNFADRAESNTTSFGVNASMTLYNGSKLKNTKKQAEINLKSGQFYSDEIKESVSLNILNAYLEILYAQESVKNAQEQITSTSEELALAKERMEIGIISKADYLQIKSELASEKSTLADAQSTLAIDRVTLMQLMELPVNDSFRIVVPDMTDLLVVDEKPVVADIYLQALEIKPQIKEATLDVESAKLDEKIAKADLYPSLSFDAGLNTGWSDDISGYSYNEQLTNQFTPSVGLSLSIPIYQNKEARINLALAKISTQSTQLDEIDVKNDLRKNIEQACVDLTSAQTQYNANLDEYDSAKESYLVASEKYGEGLLNSVDFLSVKTDLITAESDLLQAKYNLVFSSKIIDFYKGVPISLSK